MATCLVRSSIPSRRLRRRTAWTCWIPTTLFIRRMSSFFIRAKWTCLVLTRAWPATSRAAWCSFRLAISPRIWRASNPDQIGSSVSANTARIRVSFSASHWENTLKSRSLTKTSNPPEYTSTARPDSVSSPAMRKGTTTSRRVSKSSFHRFMAAFRTGLSSASKNP